MAQSSILFLAMEGYKEAIAVASVAASWYRGDLSKCHWHASG